MRRLTACWQFIRKHDLAWDLIALVGFSLTALGIGLWSVPGAFVFVGLALLAMGLLGAWLWAKRYERGGGSDS